MASPLTTRTNPLYAKDGQLHEHTANISSIQPLSSLPEGTQSLFKPPQDSTPYILTTPETIFHAQGGGQPSDTGTITCTDPAVVFTVHQVRKPDDGEGVILHMVSLSPSSTNANSSLDTMHGAQGKQQIDIGKRLLHSRIHTAGHVIGLAINQLVKESVLPSDLRDGKASHYPGAAFVEFAGLIPGPAKDAIQARVDDMVARDMGVSIHFWTEAHARTHCTGVLESFKSDADGVRVVEIGDVGSYPCGGTHVLRLSECGKVVVRGIKRQKGVSKVSYEVQDV
ncbi:alanyl-tRNA synthetase-like protein [Phaeosphaeria sp. MPI-PUGE-AT-0046c]|nr:alanyl-tRNA synthetase-like protein [Phaeosphaeria sp. MPI-PUGE-AT-0046c]